MALKADLSSLPKPATLSADGWAPDPEPRFVQLLAEKWAAEEAERGPKARATEDSRFRHSDAGKCARAIAFAALDVEPSNPMDLAGVWATHMGTLLHEAWQEVMAERYPDAEIEPKVSTVDGAGSGHLDAVIRTGDKTTAYELKTIGGFAMKMAIGERGQAQGPKFEHIVQASLNGKAVDADEIVIGYMAKEAISAGVAKKKKISEIGRVFAEWTMTREEYTPYAEREEARIRGILALLDDGLLPARKVPTPELPVGHEITNPATGGWELRDSDGKITDAGTYFMCNGYCAHQATCMTTDSGRVAIPVEIRTAA